MKENRTLGERERKENLQQVNDSKNKKQTSNEYQQSENKQTKYVGRQRL